MLYNIPIVALLIDGQERLSLAQISNTLLKDYSYNEIHNRRVALGITCVQCTPVQLELLRRAGAMPVSSRRCGMITKREAERLCKSFLADTPPPKLPENFSFDVVHHCAWGCRGSFVPSRYNSSRAKCIKCAYCALFFSPNKFIFHSHRLPDSKYVQPDAANFNSWRRHIKLNGTPPEEVSYAWEDVKAMFNGGSRRRVAVSSSSSSSSSSSGKRPRPLETATDQGGPPAKSAQGQPYFPVMPLTTKAFPDVQVPFMPPPLFCLSGKALSPSGLRHNAFTDYVWGKQSLSLPPYSGVLWPHPPQQRSSGPPGPLHLGASDSLPYPPHLGEHGDVSAGNLLPPVSQHSPPPPPLTSSTSPSAYASAFRPVVGIMSRVPTSKSPTMRPSTPACDTTTDSSRGVGGSSDGEAEARPLSRGSDSFHGEVDVTDTSSEDEASCNKPQSPKEEGEEQREEESSPPPLPAALELTRSSPNVSQLPPDTSDRGIRHRDEEAAPKTPNELDSGVTSVVEALKSENRKRDNDKPKSSQPTGNSSNIDDMLDPRRIFTLSKDELRDVLLKEAEGRKKAEREFHLMRETFEEQVQKEIAYREELAKQLQVVRDALCQELDQERKARFAVQAKLKDAHDALHHFSCKMLGPRHCAECGYKPE
ncbi:SKI family transcriptional corepressor 1 homolog-B-like [Ornithodoros turicata]|uniref:SKI family transcriptional corepressor 1 homolog-B-like n=1 Tax=Ornithodoros turicata TaxID=34597 RepID=UPI003139C22A